MKKVGGVIRNWQMHIITDEPRGLVIAKEKYPDFDMDVVAVFTGTVKESELRTVGHHMRSSVILKLNRETGECETANTLYTLVDEGGDCLPNMGPAVMGIFY